MLKRKILAALDIPLRGNYHYVYGKSLDYFASLYAEDIRHLKMQERIFNMTDFELLEEIQLWESSAGDTDFRRGSFNRLQLYKSKLAALENKEQANVQSFAGKVIPLFKA